MSAQLDLIERDLSEQLYSMRGWMGRLQKKLDRAERMQELLVEIKSRREKIEKPKIVQLDIGDIL